MLPTASLKTTPTRSATLLVIVAALGYFVDVYDLILFGVVRTPSLKSLGLSDAEVLRQGLRLFDFQMGGMLLGGILWGVLGDRRGRKSVLFGSILLYSTANLLNGFISDLTLYALLRFLAGIGLAGELGAGVTLVNETLPKEKRGYGSLIIAGVGAMGGVAAATVGGLTDWRHAYIIGGCMGLALLLLRVGTYESALFHHTSQANVRRGDFLSLFTNRRRFLLYFHCILIGIPIWYVVGVLILFSPELAKAVGVQGTVKGSQSILYGYVGLSLGDIACGLLSQYFKSRKKAIYAFILVTALVIVPYLTWSGFTPAQYALMCLVLGFFAGYWAMFITMSSEQFGTNLRATVTTTVPNFVRGAVIPITWGFRALAGPLGLAGSALLVGGLCVVLAYWATSRLEESFGKDLNFVE
jgi:MFS family permease